MSITIPVAHDFNCVWCWIALSQTKRLEAEFDVCFDWQGYELFPEGMEWPDMPAESPRDPSRPSTPGRLKLAITHENLPPLNPDRLAKQRTHNAHLAVEFAKTLGYGTDLLRLLYEGYWVHGKDINDLDVIAEIARVLPIPTDKMLQSIRQNTYNEQIVFFDDDAYAKGVFNVPTMWINGKAYAEQPYPVLRNAILEVAPPYPGFYRRLELPKLTDRAYCIGNMSSTLDGRVTISGQPRIASSSDQIVMRSIEQHADATLVGAETLRQALPTWTSHTPLRFILTASNRLPIDSEFIRSSQGRCIVLSTTTDKIDGVEVLKIDATSDLPRLTALLKEEFGVDCLLSYGGPTVNGLLLEHHLLDELFLTLCPKISGDNSGPGIVQTKASLNPPVELRLAECHPWGDEVYLRYIRN